MDGYEKKRGRGRPKKPDYEAKRDVLFFRVNNLTHLKFNFLCNFYGFSKVKMLEFLINQEAKKLEK